MLPVCISYSIYKGLSDPPLCSNCYRKWKLGTCWSHFLRASREKNVSEHYSIQTTNQYSSYQYHYALKKKSTKSVVLEMPSKNFKRSFWVFKQTENKFLLHHYLLNIFPFFQISFINKNSRHSANDISKSIQMFLYAMLNTKTITNIINFWLRLLLISLSRGQKIKILGLFIFFGRKMNSICV